MNYIQKIIEDFDFNSIHDNNDKAGSFAENVLGLVDLDLPSGLLWCKCNLGAKNETDYGDYYAWGELTTKTKYTNGNYMYRDNPIQLPSERDVATQTLGNNYSIPTKEQCEELLKYTEHEWVENYNESDVSGRLFTSKINGNSIFIPAAGYRNSTNIFDVGSYGCFWSSSLYENNTNFAWYLNLNFYGFNANMSDYYRLDGRSIRPVFKK